MPALAGPNHKKHVELHRPRCGPGRDGILVWSMARWPSDRQRRTLQPASDDLRAPDPSLGSVVKVTDLATGKNVALEVNDRGPYVRDGSGSERGGGQGAWGRGQGCHGRPRRGHQHRPACRAGLIATSRLAFNGCCSGSSDYGQVPPGAVQLLQKHPHPSRVSHVCRAPDSEAGAGASRQKGNAAFVAPVTADGPSGR